MGAAPLNMRRYEKMRNKVIFVILLIISYSIAYAESYENAIRFFQEKKAIIKGEITLPSGNSHLPPPKCGTPVFAGINALKYGGIELPSDLLETRPDTLPFTFGGDHVLVHYNNVGPNAPFEATIDTLPEDGVPDYVNRVVEIFENVWDIETGDTALGKLDFNPPLTDQGRGGDNRYDIYIMNLGQNYYGYTVPEGFAGQYQLASFIELENDFSNTAYGDSLAAVLKGVRITAAHEFFHAIQFSYDALEFDYDDVGNSSTYKPWWMEASAVWAEEIVYDDLNDYVNYLDYFFNYPWMNLGTFSYSPGDPRLYHAYGACIWPIYLSEKYGNGIIKEIWQGCASVSGYNTLVVTNNLLSGRASSLADDYLEFTIWNFHTDTRADPSRFYSEGGLFPSVNFTAFIPTPTAQPTTIGGYSNPPEHLAANYILIQSGLSEGGVSLIFDGQDISGAGWHTAFLAYGGSYSDWIDFGVNPTTGFGSLEWYNWNLYNNLLLIPTVSGTTPYYNSYNYTGSIVYDPSLFGDSIVYVWPGDLDDNGVVNEEDILPLAAYWYETGDARNQTGLLWSPAANRLWSNPPATFTDADGSGRVDIRDFLAICLNWGSTHSGTFNYGGPRTEFDIDLHRPVLEIIYDEVKDAGSGPKYEIRLYLENLLGIARPDEFTLHQNYPNPFNSSTAIEYQLSNVDRIRLTIFDLTGRQVKNLVDGVRKAGTHRVEWDGRDDRGGQVASGIYFYSLRSSSAHITRKMVLIK